MQLQIHVELNSMYGGCSGQNCKNKIAPQVSFFNHCYTFYELVVYFHRWFKYFFEVVAYYFLAA